jgi:hypothetical protein
MAFDWPPNVQTKTKVRIAQILWTLWLDFEGEIKDSPDAVKDLLEALRGHGVEIADSDIMGYRIILPHLDGGKYGHYVRRLIIGQRTKSIELVSDLPDESYLPDGAGGYSMDEQIDRQLFGGPVEPARGSVRDNLVGALAAPGPGDMSTNIESASGTGDELSGLSGDKVRLSDESPLARETTRDGVPPEQPARGDTRDGGGEVALAQEMACDEGRHPDQAEFDELDDDQDMTAVIRRLDTEAAELFTPLVAVDVTSGSHRELLDTIVSLVAELEGRLSAGVGRVEPEGRTEADWEELREQNETLARRLSSVIRRAKDAEDRILERPRAKEGMAYQLPTLQSQYKRLEANNEALMRGEKIPGQHVKAAQRFLAEVPTDRPDEGRNRGRRRPADDDSHRRRTTGSESVLAYSVGPP